MSARLSVSSHIQDLRSPGPRGLGHVRTFFDFMGDQVEFMRGMHRRYGDWVNFRLGSFNNFLVSDPGLINEVLVTQAGSFHKDRITHDLEQLLGQGLLTSEGEFWRRQRKLAAPALKRKQIASYAATMVRFTERMMATWQAGQERELHHDMMQLTMEIVTKTLFNVDAGDEMSAVEESIEKAMHYFHLMSHTLWQFVPEAFPMPARREFAEGLEVLNQVIFELIRARKANPEEGDDLLYRLIVATDDDGNHMTDAQLRDEAITMFLAGHETTALAISYTWHLLAENPDVAERLYEEVDAVLGGRSATFEDVASLTYTTAVIKESLRLHPPAWIIGREAIEDVVVGPWSVPKGAQVLVAQCVMHFKAEYFPEPTQFRPERWLEPTFEKSLPRHVYMPFGGGARVCIGNHFAMMEAVLVVATMAQKVRLDMDLTVPLRKEPSVTLRPVTPMMVTVEKRD